MTRDRLGPVLAAGAAVVLPVVTALVGCAPASQPMVQWLVQADEVCRRAQGAADADPPPQSPLPGDKLRVTAQRSRSMTDQLRELAPPEEKRSAVEQYLLALDHRNEQLGLYADALDRNPANAPAPPVDALLATTGDAATRAAALGLTVCAAGVDASLGSATTTTSVPDAPAPVPTAVGGQPEDEENTEDLPG